MSNLNFVKLNSVCDRITDGSHYSPVGITDGLPMLSVKDMEHNGFSYLDCKYISEEEYEKMLRNDCVPLLNDVLIAKDGSYLKHVFVIKEEKKQAILSSIGILRPNLKKISPDYLKYYLHSNSVKETVAKKYVSGSALPRIILKNFGEIDIIYKPLLEQQKIAKVLSDLDAKIELNNKINAELEAMAKTLYDYWFVQFDFPDKNGKPYKSSGGKMVWNEELKREIPVGWEVKSIDEYAEVKKGELITAKDSEVGEIKVVAAGISYSYKHSKANREKNTITISGSGANAGFINFWREPIFASDCITVRGNSDTETLMLLHHLKFIQAHILSQATGSAQPHVYPSDIKVLNYIVPPMNLIDDFGEIIIPMNDKIAVNQKENQELASLRDWLLPMLMNGQVSVGGYEVEDSELGMVAEDKVECKKS